jgi:hypothetical protein
MLKQQKENTLRKIYLGISDGDGKINVQIYKTEKREKRCLSNSNNSRKFRLIFVGVLTAFMLSCFPETT